MADTDNNPEQKRIADLSQAQLGVSQAQFGKINAQNEALGAVILELAAAQAQAGEIEERSIKREKFYRRRDFIFNQIVAQFQRVTAKKVAIAAQNQAERDLIEQEAQVNTGIATAKNTNVLTTLTEFMQKDIARLSDFMMGSKLQDEENRREMLAALKDNDGVGRREFKEKKYSGFLKTLGKVLIGVPFFLIGFFEGYFKQLGKLLRSLGGGPVIDKVKGFVKKLNVTIANKIKEIFSIVGKKLKPVSSALTKILAFIRKVPILGAGISKIEQGFKALTSGFTKITKGPVGKAIAKIAENARTLGANIGKLFLPIKVIIGAIAAVKGAIKGYKQEGIVGAIKESIIGVVDALVGSVLRLASSAVAFFLDFLGFDNFAESFKTSFDGMIEGIYNTFRGFVDLIGGIFTLDGEGIKESLGLIFTGLKDILFAPISAFKGLVQDIFGGGEEPSIIEKIKGLYDTIKNLLIKPISGVIGFLKKFNPFGKSENEIVEEVSKQSNRSRSVTVTSRSRKRRNNKGAEMEALEKENSDLKAMAQTAANMPVQVINQIDNSSVATSTTFNNGNLAALDETGVSY